MARLLLTNLDPAATDDEIREFLVKYGFPPGGEIVHEEGTGSRPSVIVTFAGIDASVLSGAQDRVHGMYWKKRELTARVMQDGFA